MQREEGSSERGYGHQHQSEGSDRQQVIILKRAYVIVQGKLTSMDINRSKVIRKVASCRNRIS